VLVGMLLGAAWWSATSAVRVSQTTLEASVLGEQLGHVGGSVIVVSWFVFTSAYTDHDEWLTWRVVGSIGAVIGVGTLLALTNGSHGLMWTDPRLVDAGSFLALEVTNRRPLFAFLAVNYAVILVGIYVLVRQIVTSRQLYRGQAAALVVAAAVPSLTNLQANLGVGTVAAIDLSPLAFTVSGGALVFAITRYQFLDLEPIARRRVVRNMRDGYVVLDAAERVVDLNPAAARMLDVVPDDVVGESLTDLAPAASALVTDDATAETEFVPETGNRRYVEAQRSPLGDRGEGSGQLLLLRDVTDRRGVEKRYQTLIENASDVVFVVDADATVSYVSPAIEHVLGVSAETAVGEDAIEFVHPDDRTELRAELDVLLEEPGRTRRFEFRLQDAAGSWCTLEGIGRNLLDNRFVEGVVVNARDVTDRKARERELERQNERLEEFASVVSHDLRNPLEVARSHLELVREGHDGASLDDVERAHDRMETMIENVLALAREGRRVETTEPVALGTVARAAWETVETDGATLEIVDDGTVAADPPRLQRLFENLFRNAVEHAGGPPVADASVDRGSARRRAPAGGAGAPTVRLGTLADERGFYVADDGPGLPETDDDLFAFGATTSDDGTGFGLAIVDGIAEAHGWDVRATEADGGGARFEITGVDVA